MFVKKLLIEAIYLLTVTFTPPHAHHPVVLQISMHHSAGICAALGQDLTDSIVSSHTADKADWSCRPTYST